MRQASDTTSFWPDVDWWAPLWQLFSAFERLSSLHPLSVTARKRLDISLADIFLAVRLCLKALVPGGGGEVVREQAFLEVSKAWVSATRSANGSSRYGCYQKEPIARFCVS